VPKFFKFLCLLAYDIFVHLGVDVAVLEVGMGGRLCATNIFPQPVACAIAQIGMDHVDILGNTLGLIATEKAGIMKPQVPCFTIAQSEEVMEAFRTKAASAGALFSVVTPCAAEMKLGIAGDHQHSNAALARAMTTVFLEQKQTQQEVLIARTNVGLAQCVWPGRCQTVQREQHPNRTLYIDGAHTPESIASCLHWYKQQVASSTDASIVRVLLFNVAHTRDPFTILAPIAELAAAEQTGQEDSKVKRSAFQQAYFCPFDIDKPSRVKPATLSQLLEAEEYKHFSLPMGHQDATNWQDTLVQVWNLLLSHYQLTGCISSRKVSVAVALEHVNTLAEAGGVTALITGSLYLAGNVLKALTDEEAAEAQ
jgi:folylpolyglutamate synthase